MTETVNSLPVIYFSNNKELWLEISFLYLFIFFKNSLKSLLFLIILIPKLEPLSFGLIMNLLYFFFKFV